MLNVIRRSQLEGLIAMDASTIAHLGAVENVWIDSTGKVAYLSVNAGFLPLTQVTDIGHQALSTYGRLVVDAPGDLRQLDQLVVQSFRGEPLGWIEDFLFDWQTGEVAAYLLTGQIAAPWNEAVVLSPEDVDSIESGYLRMREGALSHLQPATSGLQGYLSEKSPPVRHLVKVMSDRLHHLISPQDHPERVRIKVKAVSDELAAAGDHDRDALQEATAYLQAQWQHLQQNISRSGQRAKSAFDAAWKHLAGKP